MDKNEKGKQTNNITQNTTYNTKDYMYATPNQQKTGGDLW